MRKLLAILLAAATVVACASARVGEPTTVGGARRPYFEPGAPERIVVISAIDHELELLLAATEVERTVAIAGRDYHVGRLRGHPVVLFLGGVSLVNATMATQAAFDHFEVGAVLFSGIAGGVNPDLRIGDVVVPSQWGQYQEMVFARETPDGWDTGGRAGEFENFGMMFPRGQLVPPEDGRLEDRRRRFWFPADPAMLRVAERLAGEVHLARCAPSGHCLEHQPTLHVGGNGLTGSVFVDNAGFREYLWSTFRGDAVDMETAAIAQTAYVNQVPFLAFRSLSDLAGGGPGANEIRTFGELASDNSAAVVLGFLERWR